MVSVCKPIPWVACGIPQPPFHPVHQWHHSAQLSAAEPGCGIPSNREKVANENRLTRVLETNQQKFRLLNKKMAYYIGIFFLSFFLSFILIHLLLEMGHPDIIKILIKLHLLFCPTTFLICKFKVIFHPLQVLNISCTNIYIYTCFLYYIQL